MKGLFKRHGSEVWQARLRIPTHLWNQRERLSLIGIADIPKTQEHAISTKEYEKALAEKVYTRFKVTWNRKMDSWEKALEDGPQQLTHKQIVAIANEHRLNVVKANEDEPFDYEIPEADFSKITLDNTVSDALTEKIDPKSVDRLKRIISETDEKRRLELWQGFIIDYPEFLTGLGKPLASLLEQTHKPASDALEAKYNLHLDADTKDNLRLGLAFKEGEALQDTKKLQDGDYSKLDEVESFTPYQATPNQTQFKTKKSSSAVTFEDVLTKQKQLSDQKLDKQYKSEATFRKYRGVASEFSEWRNSGNILSVTFAEAEKWRDSLLEKVSKGTGTRTTARHKVSTLTSLLNWAITQNRSDRRKDSSVPILFAEGNPLIGMDLPSRETVDSDKKTLTLEQAKAILQASRSQTRSSLRWIPWLQAYSGIRVSEAEHIRKEDVKEYNEVWYYNVRSDDDHKTKTGKSRRIPIHKAIIEEGFLQFVDSAPDGLLFNEKRIQGNMREWVHEVMKPLGGLKGSSPTHGWRHLFTDLAEGKLDLLARYYIEGRAEPGSRETYGKSLVRLPELSKAVNRIENIVK